MGTQGRGGAAGEPGGDQLFVSACSLVTADDGPTATRASAGRAKTTDDLLSETVGR